MLTSQNVEFGVGALMPSPPRVIRTKELLDQYIKSGKKFTAEDMIEIQLDSVDVNAREIHYYLQEVIDKHWSKILEGFEDKRFKYILKKFRNHIKGWDSNYHVNSTQASLFAVWEIEFHVCFLKDQIPNRRLRETMANIPDGDLFVIDTLEGLFNDPSYLSKYCPSSLKMFGKEYELKENKCLMSLAYNAVYAWKLLENAVSTDTAKWRWGAIHKHYYEHLPFSLIPGFKQIWHREVEANGSRRTISFAYYDYYLNDFEKFIFLRSNFGANFRMAIDMATYDDPEKYPMYMSIDTGMSQSVFSSHYFDMNDIHYDKKGRVQTVGLKNAKKNAKYKFELIASKE
jgi:acyl-homoserine lactone acylase PvdQ